MSRSCNAGAMTMVDFLHLDERYEIDQSREALNPLRRILAALCAGWRAALSHWREGEPAAKLKARCSFFDVEPGTFPLPVDPDDADAAAWYRTHFRLNGRPWDGKR